MSEITDLTAKPFHGDGAGGATSQQLRTGEGLVFGKTVSELTSGELRSLSVRDPGLLASCAIALQGCLQMKEQELARSKKDHAFTEYSYAALKLDVATKECKRLGCR